jgi:hypothetical protein
VEVDVGSLHAFVPEPQGDGCGIDPGAKQLHGGGMPENVRSDPLAAKRWTIASCGPSVLSYETLYSIRAEVVSAASREERIVRHAAVFAQPILQDDDRLVVQWSAAVLAPLAPAADVSATAEVNVQDLETREFSQTKTGLDDDQQQGVVTPTVPGRPVGSRQETDDLAVVEVGDIHSL